MENIRLNRARRKYKESKQKQLWNKITELYYDNNCLHTNYIDFLKDCELFYGKKEAQPKHYIKAREIVNKPLSGHEIIELIVWWKNNT